MKIAIHKRKGSFSDRWILYCEQNNIPFKVVNCYDTNIIEQLRDCKALMWHHHHGNYKDTLFAKGLLFSLEQAGVRVFPDFNTSWHFDDKVGQKYLMESINAPVVPTYIFYDKKTALEWISSTTFPKVFKLRGGAGSANVKLIQTKEQAKKLVKRAFNKGFPLNNRIYGLKETYRKLRQTPDIKTVILAMKVMVRFVFPKHKTDHLLADQKGYVYFQDFIPKNDFDDRIIIIGAKAIAIRRYNRENDFRASGSGIIKHDPTLFNKESIKIAFDITKKLNAKSLAFDFIYNEDNKPLVVEISYTYSQGAAYDNCPGYWDEKLNWHEDQVDPQRFIIEDFLNTFLNLDE